MTKSKPVAIQLGTMNWEAVMSNVDGDLVIRFFGCGDIADNHKRPSNLRDDLKIRVYPA
jgi:hypothetical protein